MAFGGEDIIPTQPEDVQRNTITWRWKETKEITNAAAPYIGHIIKYSKDKTTWYNSSEIAFVVSEDGWQEGTVTGLEPDTQYWFDIVVYRKYTDGNLYVSPYTTQDNVGILTAKTLSG